MLVATVMTHCRCSLKRTSLHRRLLPVILQRSYSNGVSASSPQVQQPLNYIQGQRVNPSCDIGAGTFDLFAPATGTSLRKVQCSGQHDVDTAVNVAAGVFPCWSALSPFERGQVLTRAANIIRCRAEELARTEVLDTGKPIWEARFDILACADAIQYYGGLAPTLTGQVIPTEGGSFAYTVREPLGVVGAIGAWNYPFQMAAWKSAPALACGNTFVFKPSQYTPLTAVMLGEIYTEAGLPNGCYNVVQGEAKTGSYMCDHPGIAKMSFTGSVPTGVKIMESCAKGLKHVTLELGGKSPLIIFDDADLENAVKGAMVANFTNQGQVCSNGTRVFVQNKIMGYFLRLLLDKTQRMIIGDPNCDRTTVGATIHAQQADRVIKYVEGAEKEGANVLYGGKKFTPSPALANGIYISPCILTDCKDEMKVVKEEVFGAVMSVLAFDREEEVIQRANDTEFGLAAGIFTSDLTRAHRVASQVQAGSLYINNYNVYPVGVPFGGYKKSGMGRENGADAFDYYSQVKSVYVEMNDVDCPF